MPARFQLVIDCKDPELLARFWAAALGYVLEPPPEGFATWDDWRRDIGLPDSELGIGADSIIEPRGDGPRIPVPPSSFLAPPLPPPPPSVVLLSPPSLCPSSLSPSTCFFSFHS